MRREYYIDGEQVTRYTFFECLEEDVFKYWQNEPHCWPCFEDYYGYVKQKIRSGSEYIYGHTYWSEVIRWKLLKYALWFIAETVIILLFLALWWS